MRWYRTGTANVTLNSTNVTGNGVDWLAGARVGEGFMGPDGRVYEISTIVSATQLTLGTPYLGATASAAAYQIVPTQSFIRDLAAQAAQLVTDFTTVAVNHVSVVGNQTIHGVKTFSSPIVGSTNTQVSLTGDQTIAGAKTFTGNVGIGMSSLNYKAVIYDSVTNTDVLTLANPQIQPNSGPNFVGMSFQDNHAIGGAPGNVSAIRSHSNLVNTWGTDLTFWTTAVGGPNLVERARIDSAGNFRVTGDIRAGGQFVIRNGNPTVHLQDTDGMSAMLHCNSNLFHVLRGDIDSTAWTQVNGHWPLTINLANNDATCGGSFTAVGNITAGGQFIGNGAVPPGAVMHFAMNSPPTGWLRANGAAVSRATFAALFAVLGTHYGAGDGSTTFNLPDLRGEFLRGWDDGRGVDSGRVFGSAQGDLVKSHVHNFVALQDLAGGDGRYDHNGVSTTVGAHDFDSHPRQTAGLAAATENRPRNVALLACIKF